MSASEANSGSGVTPTGKHRAGVRGLPHRAPSHMLVLSLLAVAMSACTFDPELNHRVRVDVHNACDAPIRVLVGETPDSFRATESSDGMYEVPVTATTALPEALEPRVGRYLYLWVVAPSARDTGRPVRLETGSLATLVDNSGLTHYQIDVAGPLCP